MIYFHAFTAKLFVPEWLNGTATYYWFTHQIFGVPEYLRVTIAHLLSIPFVGICITWGGIFIELILFAWLFMSRNSWNWKIILFIGILFHLLIALIHGLVSFSLVMIAALILYLVPKNKNFKIRRKTATNIA